MSSILECIRTVGRGERGRKPLSFEQAYRIMDEYLSGEVGDDQMAMLLMLIRVQNETNEEIAGFVKAVGRCSLVITTCVRYRERTKLYYKYNYY